MLYKRWPGIFHYNGKRWLFKLEIRVRRGRVALTSLLSLVLMTDLLARRIMIPTDSLVQILALECTRMRVRQ